MGYVKLRVEKNGNQYTAYHNSNGTLIHITTKTNYNQFADAIVEYISLEYSTQEMKAYFRNNDLLDFVMIHFLNNGHTSIEFNLRFGDGWMSTDSYFKIIN